jgi:hypothetical protein
LLQRRWSVVQKHSLIVPNSSETMSNFSSKKKRYFHSANLFSILSFHFHFSHS